MTHRKRLVKLTPDQAKEVEKLAATIALEAELVVGQLDAALGKDHEKWQEGGE